MESQKCTYISLLEVYKSSGILGYHGPDRTVVEFPITLAIGFYHH